MTSEFDPDKWWTWPIPEHCILTRRPNGEPWRLDSWGDGWCDGFEAGRNSLAEDVLRWQQRAEDYRQQYWDLKMRKGA